MLPGGVVMSSGGVPRNRNEVADALKFPLYTYIQCSTAYDEQDLVILLYKY